MSKRLTQIFCDGSIVRYIEDHDHLYYGDATLTMINEDGTRPSTKVSRGYLQAKIDFLRASGNRHKILSESMRVKDYYEMVWRTEGKDVAYKFTDLMAAEDGTSGQEVLQAFYNTGVMYSQLQKAKGI